MSCVKLASWFENRGDDFESGDGGGGGGRSSRVRGCIIMCVSREEGVGVTAVPCAIR